MSTGAEHYVAIVAYIQCFQISTKVTIWNLTTICFAQTGSSGENLSTK